jgi:GNAT superfamily N-acetyltransferase
VTARAGVDVDLVSKWVRGWALSRGKAAPETIEGGWRVQVDEPEQIARYVFPSGSEAVRRLTRSISPALTPIKVCAIADEVAPLLTPPWRIDRTSPMMIKPALTRVETNVTGGYTPMVTGVGNVLIAMALTDANDIVAGGRVALIDEIAVFDQIWTHDAHRRRGLASNVMRTLENVAVERGATRGMLVATEAGRAVYSTLGWRVYAPYTTAIVPNA